MAPRQLEHCSPAGARRARAILRAAELASPPGQMDAGPAGLEPVAGAAEAGTAYASTAPSAFGGPVADHCAPRAASPVHAERQ